MCTLCSGKFMYLHTKIDRGPGSGKGTQCSLLVEREGFVHLSAGELLRIEKASGSENAKLIHDVCMAGKIVPVKITVNLIKNAMEKAGWASKRYLIDGFPRNEDNVEGWNAVIGPKANIKKVIYFECDEEELIKRMYIRVEQAGE